MNFVKWLNLFGVEAKEIPCLLGSGAPTNATIGAVGLFYMDTDNGNVYKCTAASDNAYTWEVLESGNGGGSVGNSVNPPTVSVSRFSDSVNGDGVLVTVTNYNADGSFTKDSERLYDGEDGVTPTIGTVSVETIGADEEPSGSISGPNNHLVLNLKIPSGGSGGNVDLAGYVQSVNGVSPDANGNVEISVSGGTAAAIDYDQNVKAINHRGYCTVAPENTIPAYILSKKNGFNYVECDVSFTSDGVAVLLHDSTIDRTSDGTGSISELTYAETLQYDFGSWKSADYAGTKIATLSEFLSTCKGLGLHPYIELKNNGNYTQEQIVSIVDAVNAHGMKGKVTYISSSASYLEYVKTADSAARLGYVVDTITESTITTASGLKTTDNEVFVDAKYTNLTDETLAICVAAGIPLELWTVNSLTYIQGMNMYVSGVTSDNWNAGKVLYDKYSVYDAPDIPNIPDNPDVPEKTLTSISATYSGGDVTVGTAVTALTGIVVTATYSDGSTETVTGYTLSGTIAEGSNTITVSYGGKTATFTVTGVAESGGDNELEGWELYRTIAADELQQIALYANSPYTQTKRTRLSYVPFDIQISASDTYKFVYETELATTNIGLPYYPANVTELVSNGTGLGNITTDDGWLENGVEKAFGIDGYCRMTFRVNTGNTPVTVGQIGPVRIYRKTASV